MRHEQLRGLLSLSGVCGTPVTLVEEGCSPLLVLAHRAVEPGDGAAGQCRACAEQGWGLNVCFYEDAIVLLAVNNWPQFLDACPRHFCMQVSSRCCLRYTGMTWRCSEYYWLWWVCNDGTQSWVMVHHSSSRSAYWSAECASTTSLQWDQSVFSSSATGTCTMHTQSCFDDYWHKFVFI